MNCLICEKELIGKQKRFCSIKCKNIYHQGCNNSIHKKQTSKGKIKRKILIKALGNKCVICGYDKNFSALNFHHIDKNLKSFGLTVRECSNMNIEKLLTEAKKCILLCANCHMELHYPDDEVNEVELLVPMG